MSETTHYVIAITGRTGRRQSGYAIRNATRIVATFRWRDYDGWRIAKAAAQRECHRLNSSATRGAEQ